MRLLFFILLLSCSGQRFEGPRLADQLPPPEQGEKWEPHHELQAREILAMTKDLVEERKTEDGHYRRDAHPKAHGCVKGQFRIHADELPPQLRVGLFSSDADYPVLVRFSNANQDGEKYHDAKPDVRGMAMKIQGTPSGDQDLIMNTTPEFFSKDGDDYIRLFRALLSGKTSSFMWYALTAPTSAYRAYKALVQIDHPLNTDYHSSTVYKLGSTSMRFGVKPCIAKPSLVISDELPKNFLSERLAETLTSEEGCFEFFVQPNKDPKWNDIEDPRIPWDKKVSPLVRVGTIHLPKQSGVSDSTRMNLCDLAAFDPWRTSPETRPMGQINRMRFFAYKEIARLRQRK